MSHEWPCVGSTGSHCSDDVEEMAVLCDSTTARAGCSAAVGSAVERIDLLNLDGPICHGKNLAQRQADQIRTGGGAAGKDSCQGMAWIAPGMDSQSAALLRRVVPVEPIQHEEMRVAVQAQEGSATRLEDLQVRGLAISLNLAHRVRDEGPSFGRPTTRLGKPAKQRTQNATHNCQPSGFCRTKCV